MACVAADFLLSQEMQFEKDYAWNLKFPAGAATGVLHHAAGQSPACDFENAGAALVSTA